MTESIWGDVHSSRLKPHGILGAKVTQWEVFQSRTGYFKFHLHVSFFPRVALYMVPKSHGSRGTLLSETRPVGIWLWSWKCKTILKSGMASWVRVPPSHSDSDLGSMNWVVRTSGITFPARRLLSMSSNPLKTLSSYNGGKIGLSPRWTLAVDGSVGTALGHNFANGLRGQCVTRGRRSTV